MVNDKKYNYLPYDRKLVEKSRENRKNPTVAEKKMWYQVLRNREFENLKFTRQKPIDHFIVDFYCSELMLAIEIDGDSHADKLEYDNERTEKLESYGIVVVRYTNSNVLQNVAGVYQDLKRRVAQIKADRSNVPL